MKDFILGGVLWPPSAASSFLLKELLCLLMLSVPISNRMAGQTG